MTRPAAPPMARPAPLGRQADGVRAGMRDSSLTAAGARGKNLTPGLPAEQCRGEVSIMASRDTGHRGKHRSKTPHKTPQMTAVDEGERRGVLSPTAVAIEALRSGVILGRIPKRRAD